MIKGFDFRIVICGVRSGKTHWARTKLGELGKDFEALYASYSMTLGRMVTVDSVLGMPATVGSALAGSQFDVAILDDLIQSREHDTHERAHVICDWVETVVLPRIKVGGSATWIITPMARVGLASIALKRFVNIASFEFGLPDTGTEFPALSSRRGFKG